MLGIYVFGFFCKISSPPGAVTMIRVIRYAAASIMALSAGMSNFDRRNIVIPSLTPSPPIDIGVAAAMVLRGMATISAEIGMENCSSARARVSLSWFGRLPTDSASWAG